MNNLVEKTVNSIDVSKITEKLNGEQIVRLIEKVIITGGICYLAKIGGDFTLSYGDASLTYTGKRNSI